ncbi:hypothetical protein TNCT_151231 [Trichonephila clavata]|uniref:Uncharacterized protein n=1 Tax=Trichonephila clavata TaxID=2740835 RepID=A0A8X6J7R2_TRICU|nr:hypothetical protein TNCT_151231 [Trichonephila clavata]
MMETHTQGANEAKNIEVTLTFEKRCYMYQDENNLQLNFHLLQKCLPKRRSIDSWDLRSIHTYQPETCFISQRDIIPHA